MAPRRFDERSRKTTSGFVNNSTTATKKEEEEGSFAANILPALLCNLSPISIVLLEPQTLIWIRATN